MSKGPKYDRCACNPVEHLCGNEEVKQLEGVARGYMIAAEKAEAALLAARQRTERIEDVLRALLQHHDSYCDAFGPCTDADEARRNLND